MTNKNKSLKDIHQYLIDNNYFHCSDNYLINKGIIKQKDNDKQNSAHLYKKPQILNQNGEIY